VPDPFPAVPRNMYRAERVLRIAEGSRQFPDSPEFVRGRTSARELGSMVEVAGDCVRGGGPGWGPKRQIEPAGRTGRVLRHASPGRYVSSVVLSTHEGLGNARSWRR
jgi:hypothetical protein